MLLATGSAGGTISAVRELSKYGLKVSVISNSLFCPSSWSRYASRSYKGPPERESRLFLDLLLEIGAANPGQVLLPTSDETAWLYTRNASVLEKYFRLNQPPIETIERIVDKKLLSDVATEAGLCVLPTWEPRSYSDVVATAPSLPYPILIKPRTQVRRLRNDKGMVASSAGELIENFQRFMALEHAEAETRFLPDTDVPLLQYFVAIGAEGVYSVTGYIDRTGEHFVTRHATKVFQRSQPAGVGVCFESLPTDPELSAAVYRLCRALGYFGIFEVEFIRFNGRWAVIDFNPRLFNQAGMDAWRGMPLALFAYLDAAGRRSDLHEAIARAQQADKGQQAVFYDRFTLSAILAVKALTRRVSRDERSYWRNWIKSNASHSVDFAADSSDVMPGFIHAVSEMILGVKALRKFFRSTPRIAAVRESAAIKVHQ